MDKRDLDCLLFIKFKLGGNLYAVSTKSAYRYLVAKKDKIKK